MSSSVTPSDTVVPPSSSEPSASVPPDPVPSDPVPSDPPASSDPPTQPSDPPTPSDPVPSDPSNPSPSNPGGNPSPSQPPPTPGPNPSSGGGGNNSPTVLSQPSTSLFESTIVETENGSTITRVTQISTVFQPGATIGVGSSGEKKSSNTGAIVGGVVGGVVGLAALILLFWFITKRARQRRLEKEFDGDFDPDRIVRRSDAFPRPPAGGGTLPDLGLDEEESRITPFPAPASTPSMTQRPPTTPSTMTSFNTNPYSVNPQQHINDPHPYQGGYPLPIPVNRPPSVIDNQSQSAYSQSTGYTHPSMYQQPQQHAPYPPAGGAGPAYASSQGSSSVSGGGQIPSRKAQEAGFGRMMVTNPNDVVVHRDGGRVPEPSAQHEELPPTYDSIPDDRPQAEASASAPPRKN